MATLFCIIPLKKIGGYFARWLVSRQQTWPDYFRTVVFTDAGSQASLTPLQDLALWLACAIAEITRKPGIALGKPQAALRSQACESGPSTGCAGEGLGEAAPLPACRCASGSVSGCPARGGWEAGWGRARGSCATSCECGEVQSRGRGAGQPLFRCQPLLAVRHFTGWCPKPSVPCLPHQ